MAQSSESPLLRRKRDAAVANQQCIEVQWRFLQQRNPTPPQFVRSPRRVGVGVRSMPSIAPSSPSSRLAQLFAQEPTAADGPRDSITDGTNVVQDLMGETQRQAMMDRILAEMKALVVADTKDKLPPVTTPNASLNSPRSSDEDEDEDDLAFDARRLRRGNSVLTQTLRSSMSIVSAYDGANEGGSKVISLLPQRRLSQLAHISPFEGSDDDDDAQDEDNDEEEEDDRVQDEQGAHHTASRRRQEPSESTWSPRINVQKTARTQIAVDLPASLSPPLLLVRQASRPPALAVGSKDETDAAAIRPQSLMEPGYSPSRGRSSHQRRRRERAPIPSPRSNQYGSAWYLPRTQWWSRHAVDWTPPPDPTPHCHHTAAAHPRHHKPTVATGRSAFPSQPLMAPSGASPSSAAGHQNGGPISMAAPSSSASATSGVIPHSFIGREYRQFILAQGSPLPPYLQPQ